MISKKERVTKQENEIGLDAISGYVTCCYDTDWWLAFVLDIELENAEVKVTFLHPQGPARLFKYPSIPDILTVPYSDILTRVSPNTVTGRTYTFSRTESKLATEKLAAKNEQAINTIFNICT